MSLCLQASLVGQLVQALVGQLHRQEKVRLMSSTSLHPSLNADQTEGVAQTHDQALPQPSANLPLTSRGHRIIEVGEDL